MRDGVPLARRLAAATIGLGAVAACIAFAAPSQAADYVAMGDSYSSGTGTRDYFDENCERSNFAYSKLIDPQIPGDWNMVACGGAKTSGALTQAGHSSVGSGTEYVTISIGGNDIGFGDIVQECATRSPLQPTGSACKDHYTAGGTDQLAQRVDDAASEVAGALAAIDGRSPDARVLVVGYPAILPDEGPGCFPVVPFSPGDVAYLRGVEKDLNAMLAKQAAAAGHEFVDTYTPSIGHDSCQPPGTKWVEGLVPTAPAAPVHPNALGMKEIGQVVAGAAGGSSTRAAA